MKNHFKKTLLVYKKSAYSIYFIERKIKFATGGKANLEQEVLRFKKAHEEHYTSLKHVERVLNDYGVTYDKLSRGAKVNYANYDLVITVGGDGTFLEASRKIKGQAIIGVNSAPSYSVGRLCIGNTGNFERIIRSVTRGRFAINLWQRLRLRLEGYSRPVDCVNDVLVCHLNPAAMSRYYLHIGGVREEQRSSGLWIATPAGSTGAIQSAGGKKMDIQDSRLQYCPRELYYGFNRRYQLTGGLVAKGEKFRITSLMRNGMIFVDGTHCEMNFPFNTQLNISLSPQPLRTVKV